MKIKNLFKFIPVVCLSVLSCLSAVLFRDQAVKPTYADNMFYSSFNVNGVTLSYVGNNGVTVHKKFDLLFDFYKDVDNDSFSLNLTMTSYYNYDYLTLNNVDYYHYYYDVNNNRSVSYVVTFNNLVDNGFSGNIRNVSLIYRNVYSDLSQYYCGVIGLGSQVYARFGYHFTLTLNIDGFNSMSITYPYAGNEFIRDNYNMRGLTDTQAMSLFPYDSYTNLNVFENIGAGVLNLTMDDYQRGYEEGYHNGYTNGQQDGYSSGQSSGYTQGYINGWNEGRESREQEIINAYNDGYHDGYNEGFSVDSTASTIFSGILQVGMLPINVLLAIFNFEVLGINISSLVSALLTVCLTVIVIRTVTGSKE